MLCGSARRTIRKLGEGVYSEVFYFEDDDDESVLKVHVKCVCAHTHACVCL